MGGSRQTEKTMLPIRYLTAALAVLTLCGVAIPGHSQPHAHAATITCTNPTSGATWQISIDYDHATVDTNAAQLGDTEISWRDGKDGANYSLDLRSGDLTATVASSTGGYFLRHHCRLPS
jgi:hypothetical protein